MKRDKVWLGVSGLVINEQGEWLVVTKQYGGMKGMWSFPAGFVDNGETADQAVLREIYEETGIEGSVEGVIGLRTGVIKDIISDNMIIFLVRPAHTTIRQDIPDEEIEDVQFRSTDDLYQDDHCSPMVRALIDEMQVPLRLKSTTSPGKQFNYTHYHLFL